MRISVTLDDALLEEAEALTRLKGPADLLSAALKALIEQESARRLARFGGTEKRIASAPRRREEWM
jgi:hypothetical protein